MSHGQIEQRPNVGDSIVLTSDFDKGLQLARASRLRRDSGDSFWNMRLSALKHDGVYSAIYDGTHGWVHEFLANNGINTYNEKEVQRLTYEIKEILLHKIKWKHLLLVVTNDREGLYLELHVLHKKYNNDHQNADFVQMVATRENTQCDNFEPLNLAPWTLHYYSQGDRFVLFGNDGKSKDEQGKEINVQRAFQYGKLGVAQRLVKINLRQYED